MNLKHIELTRNLIFLSHISQWFVWWDTPRQSGWCGEGRKYSVIYGRNIRKKNCSNLDNAFVFNSRYFHFLTLFLYGLDQLHYQNKTRVKTKCNTQLVKWTLNKRIIKTRQSSHENTLWNLPNESAHFRSKAFDATAKKKTLDQVIFFYRRSRRSR